MWRQLTLSLGFGLATLLILVAGRSAPQTCPRCQRGIDSYAAQLTAGSLNNAFTDDDFDPRDHGHGNGNGNGNIGNGNGNGNLGNGNGNFNQGSNNGNGNVGSSNGNMNLGNGHGNCEVGSGHGNFDRDDQPHLPQRPPCPPFGARPQHPQPTRLERIFIQAPKSLIKQGV